MCDLLKSAVPVNTVDKKLCRAATCGARGRRPKAEAEPAEAAAEPAAAAAEAPAAASAGTWEEHKTEQGDSYCALPPASLPR